MKANQKKAQEESRNAILDTPITMPLLLLVATNNRLFCQVCFTQTTGNRFLREIDEILYTSKHKVKRLT